MAGGVHGEGVCVVGRGGACMVVGQVWQAYWNAFLLDDFLPFGPLPQIYQ